VAGTAVGAVCLSAIVPPNIVTLFDARGRDGALPTAGIVTLHAVELAIAHADLLFDARHHAGP